MTDSKQIIELKESLKPTGKPDSGNPLDEIDVPEFREGYKIPPGSLGEFMCEIENHFENREEDTSLAQAQKTSALLVHLLLVALAQVRVLHLILLRLTQRILESLRAYQKAP